MVISLFNVSQIYFDLAGILKKIEFSNLEVLV